MKSPKLVPSCSGWQEDLPHPDEVPVVMPALGFDTPNHQDDVFLELPRSSALFRGLVIWFAPVFSFQLAIVLWLFLSDWRELSVEEWSIFFPGVFVAVWSLLLCVKVDAVPPRDQPLRFNRARQRLYA
ncbi:hypothetical protein NTG44_14660, partial [Pseudomonas sp. 20P_3.2_Bac4]|nr:hypothetical protein [Pseudomonas sp. 20P_3.2_Bac4]MCU1744052.1 hypothetical protein [Pseudomonas sp. 20P_3.2_Bac5]